jgi:hypothetical protein
VEGVRSTLRAALAQADLETWVIEIEADGASRTLLINGRDVTGRTREDGHACRLELPTKPQKVEVSRNSAQQQARWRRATRHTAEVQTRLTPDALRRAHGERACEQPRSPTGATFLLGPDRLLSRWWDSQQVT